MPGINFFRKQTPPQSVFVKKVRMFGSELHRIPEKRVVLHRDDSGACKQEKKYAVCIFHRHKEK
jgi:hypothetical protein